jgi:hypothetical protein
MSVRQRTLSDNFSLPKFPNPVKFINVDFVGRFPKLRLVRDIQVSRSSAESIKRIDWAMLKLV